MDGEIMEHLYPLAHLAQTGGQAQIALIAPTLRIGQFGQCRAAFVEKRIVGRLELSGPRRGVVDSTNP